MAELLSMTLLSPEPVSAAKPQAALSNDASPDVSTGPDQSFAATLAAEVNGKAPEKSVKSLSKGRQNTASDAEEHKKLSDNQSAGAAETKNEATPSAVKSPSEHDEDAELIAVDTDGSPVTDEKAEAGHSQWLNLLEKAKSLHDRLTKAEKAGADTKVTPEPRVDKPGPGMPGESEELLTLAKQQADKAVGTEALTAAAAGSANTKAGTEPEGAIALNKKQAGDHSSEQQLSEAELKALKLVAQTEQKTKNDAVETAVKQAAVQKAQQSEDKTLVKTNKDTGPDQSKIIAHIEKSLLKGQQDAALSLSETPAETPEAVGKNLAKVNKDTGPDYSKIIAHIEKPLKGTVHAVNAEQQSAGGLTAETTPLVVVNKTLLQADQQTLAKGIAVTVSQTDAEQEIEADSLTTPATTDLKVSVQAQSAAALVAPVASQTKAVAVEAKVTTEEALKQLQSATVQTQTEQGASSSSGGSEQQSKAETLLSVIEQQKGSSPVVTETNSFSNQLKSSLEKTNAAITVTGRETVAEQSQKQVDPLGQKLNLVQPEASNQLKEKMLMMVKDKVHTAEIRLDPSELGSMQIKINLQQDQMSVQFMVQQGNAKELMEQQMPKLRELLQQQGIELSQGSVQQQNQSSSGQEGGRRTAGGSGSAMGTADELVDSAIIPTKNSDRVVDYYA